MANNTEEISESTFGKLPIEMITHILSFLTFEDRIASSSVCWSWYEASIHPMFLTKEVICFRNNSDVDIQSALKVYTKSKRALFAFQICGFGYEKNIKMVDKYHWRNTENKKTVVDEHHWTNTVWPLLATKVFSLEFDLSEFVEGLLPSMVNATQQLKILKIGIFQFCPSEDLLKVKKLESLEELILVNFSLSKVDHEVLLRIIPKHLQKICLTTVIGNEPIVEGIVKVLSYCSSHLKTLKLIDVDVPFEIIQSIAPLNLKLNTFGLVISNQFAYSADRDRDIVSELFKTQWPLIHLNLCVNCWTHDHLCKIVQKFENLEFLDMISTDRRIWKLAKSQQVLLHSLRETVLKNFRTKSLSPNAIMLKKIK